MFNQLEAANQFIKQRTCQQNSANNSYQARALLPTSKFALFKPSSVFPQAEHQTTSGLQWPHSHIIQTNFFLKIVFFFGAEIQTQSLMLAR